MAKQEHLSIKKLYNELKSNVLFPVLLYIPKEELRPYIRPQDFEKITNSFQNFHQLLYINSLRETFIVDANSDISDLFYKKQILDDNLFEMLSMQHQLTSTEFDFLLHKYGKLTYVYWSIHSILYDIIANIEDDNLWHQLPTLKIQQQQLEMHYHELLALFPQIDFEYEVATELQNVLIENFVVDGNDLKFKKRTIQKVQNQQQQKLLNNEDATKFLLTTVFNVKMEIL